MTSQKSHTIEEIKDTGAPIALRMLIEATHKGEPFVTYGDIAAGIHAKLGGTKINPRRIGKVADSMIEQILELDPNAPLINTLITRSDGLPGDGISGHLAKRYPQQKLEKWETFSKSQKLEIVERERKKVRLYKGWEKLEKELFSSPASIKGLNQISKEKDGNSPDGRRGGASESKEHKKLKEWVRKNPQRIGLPQSFGQGRAEVELESADIVDVMFTDGAQFAVVEVKSCRSGDGDLKRGIYQCVKYRAVKEAQEQPVKTSVRAILVTERDLPRKLQKRARLLRVKTKKVSINKRCQC